jgi:hypothetical protein
LVFWTQGANLKMAIRSAALASAGTWSAGTIDTGVAPRAVEVSVNPLDQVGVVFATDTAATGRVKFLYCDAPCAGASTFQTMSATPFIENTNVVAAEVSTGISWCQASSTSYYPAVTYAITGLTRYAVCQNSLTNCLTNTNWTPQTIIGTGNVSTKLLLDPTVVGDVPKAVSLGAGGIIPYRMGATACTAAPAAFSAGAAIGGATSGNQWMTPFKMANGKFGLAANESTTSVRYYNSQTTDVIGAWNTAGLIETIALPAAQGGGAAVDEINKTVYLSYGTNAAPFDMRVGRIEDYTVASNTATVA